MKVGVIYVGLQEFWYLHQLQTEAVNLQNHPSVSNLTSQVDLVWNPSSSQGQTWYHPCISLHPLSTSFLVPWPSQVIVLMQSGILQHPFWSDQMILVLQQLHRQDQQLYL